MRRTPKIAASLLLLACATPLVLAASMGGCSSTDASFATGCTNYTPDAGTSDNVTCSIGWSCDDGAALFQMTCVQDERPEYYDCNCGNGTTNTMYIVVDTFICTPAGALSTANMGCLFDIQQ